MIFYFGKMKRNESGNMIIVLPQKISQKMTLGKEYAIIIVETSFMEKVITKYRGIEKICVRTS